MSETASVPEVSPETPRAESGSASDRDAAGRFVAGNRAGVVHGGRSSQALALQAPLRAEDRAKVLSDLGIEENELPAVLSDAVDTFTELRLIRRAYFTFLELQGGPIARNGRQRTAARYYLNVIDRQLKIAALLGIERKAKQTNDLSDLMSGDEAVG